MLKVKRVDVSGFKSFVDPVAVELAGGITAIVGPNGCGKSNISDAVSWVLGEQSAKSLRGGTMEDVIFSGSEGRKPLGMAEVTMTLATDPSFPHAEEGRVTIGRRVFRTGESQYRLNGRVVRLKEIKDLLMDTGLGLRAYSTIEQGKIGMILSGKPQERRRLLEEAAGITRYKARKRVAEVKLEESVANLLRLDDVISEVERSLRSLKRQASAARRYQVAEGEHRELLEQVLVARRRRLDERLGVVEGRLAEALSREAEQAAALGRDEAALAAGREELDRLAERLAAKHQVAAELAATIEGRQEFLKGARERLQEIAERTAGGRTLADGRAAEAERLAADLAAVAERRAEIERERAAAADAVDRDTEAVAAAGRELAAAERRREELRRELLDAADVENRLRTRLHQGALERERAASRHHHLEREAEEQATELAAAAEGLELARARITELETAVAERREAAERRGDALGEAIEAEKSAAGRQREAETALAADRQRHEMLAELARAHAERRTVLADALAAGGVDRPAYLAAEVEAVEGWERALDLYLGELADAVVLPEGNAAGDALALAEALHGRAAAHLIRPLPAPAGTGDGLPEVDDPAVVLSLAEALHLSPGLAAALPPAYLAASAADAERLAATHRGVAFLAPEGLWFEGGLVHVGGPRGEPGVLEREREIRRLEAALPGRETELAAAVAELERRVTARAEAAREKNRAETEVAAVQQELAVARARGEDAAARHRRLGEERDRLAAERATLAGELAALGERHAAAEAEIRSAVERHAALRERFDQVEGEVAEAKRRREALRETSADRRGRLDLLAERLESHEREIARLEGTIAEARRQAEAWRAEEAALAERRERLSRDMATAEAELAGALERRAASQDDVVAEQERLDERRAALRGLEKRIAEVRAEREGGREEIERLRVEQAETRSEAGHVAAAFRDEFERELPAPAPDEEPLAAERLAELEADLARTKAKLERLGPVNVLAVEEHEAEEERHRFLTEQRADVAASVDSLRKTIREINRTSSERFLETFAAVNAAFGELFTHLFRGGEAEMRLLDEDDPLESSIEIVARPPGKRLQNIQLMSGGEKALTAVALLFALFRTKPSPFCILDEVDAPLDDANTLRFVELLREMAGDTQFLVITHNKLTMEAAGTLYGVTMEERGVSKLVAVEIDEVHPEPTAATAATA